jgi:hypothetical protein
MLRKVGLVLLCLLAVVAVDALAQARITASAMDADGNVYVTGWSAVVPNSSAYPYEARTIKYDRSGNVVWSHGYPNDPTKPDCEPWGIALDPWGNVYVAGHVSGAFGVDCLLVKYPHDYSQGEAPEWARTYDGGVGHDQNWTIAVDSDGHVYVTGYSVQINAGIQSQDIITIKYDGQGNAVWTRLYNSPASSNEQAYAIAVDPVSKNVYVTGASRAVSGTVPTDIITIMYDEQGTLQWARTYDGPSHGQDRGTSVALDADGYVYVTGYSAGENLSLDFATIKYDAWGNELWVARYDGPAGGNDQPAPPVGSAGGATYNYIQNNQGIIVTEELLDPVPALKYLKGHIMGLDLNRGLKNSLEVKLEVCLNSLLADNADLRENAVSVLGAFINHCESLYVEGVLSEYDADWLTGVAAHIIQGILGISTRVVYVSGQSTGVGTNVDFATVKYDAADGRPMWRIPGQPGTAPGQPGHPADIALRYDGASHFIDRAWGMAIDQAGHIYVTGPGSVDYAAQSVDYLTVKYLVNTYEPAPLAIGLYNGPANKTDQACGFATWRDPASGRHYIYMDPVSQEHFICVTGNSANALGKNEFAAVMYDGGLVEQWVRRYPW